ncbi:PEP-CTERM/exosortase system-associated acyltransferase [Halomonas sp. V046]|uniref:PEP-CTERM/exosortase system-associated acyltransferase n=1 Tax=Halomonas sp. V046 TaxID=3459611 RepID=UPI004043CF8A
MPADVIDEMPRHQVRQSLLTSFAEDFRFQLAITPRDRDRVHALRHEVFLKELQYRMEEDPGRHLERDDFDGHSLHCLIEHRDSGLAAGCLRLVLPRPGSDDCLPVVCQSSATFTQPELHPLHLPRKDICEVSRLAIARPFRLRPGRTPDTEFEVPTETLFSPQQQRTFPLIVTGLFLCTYALVSLTRRRHVYALMEPRLPRLLALSGFHFQKVSETLHYHGVRNAFYIDHRRAEQEMHADLEPLYQHIKDSLAPDLAGIQLPTIARVATLG